MIWRVDRVDRWLNVQRGWRRLVIGWLVFAPVFLDVGLLWSSWGNRNDQGTVPTGSVLAHVAIALAVGIPLAAVLVAAQVRVQKIRPWTPWVSWRMIVGLYVFMAGNCAATYGETRTLTWQHQHVPDNVLYLADAVFFLLVLWTVLYYRKLRRQAEADGPVAAN